MRCKFEAMAAFGRRGLAMVLSVEAQQGAASRGSHYFFLAGRWWRVSPTCRNFPKPRELICPNAIHVARCRFWPRPSAGRAAAAPQPPAVSISAGQQIATAVDEQKDWTLMTPEEIMGVTSPEKNFRRPGSRRDGLAEKSRRSGALFWRGKTSRNLWRRTISRRTMRLRPGAFPTTVIFNGRAQSGQRHFGSPPQTLSQLFNNAPQHSDDFVRPECGCEFRAAVWRFISAAGVGFRATDGNGTVPKIAAVAFAAATTAENSGGSTSFSSQPSPDNNFGQPVVNPIGASYTPLTSGIGTPAGLAPLPGLLHRPSRRAAGNRAGLDTADAAVDVDKRRSHS